MISGEMGAEPEDQRFTVRRRAGRYLGVMVASRTMRWRIGGTRISSSIWWVRIVWRVFSRLKAEGIMMLSPFKRTG